MTHPFFTHTKMSLDFLHGRGLTDLTIARARLGYERDGPFRASISIPYLGPMVDARDPMISAVSRAMPLARKRIIRGVRYRYLQPRSHKYDQAPGSGNHLYNVLDTLKSRIFLTEGELDCLCLVQMFNELGLRDCGAVGIPGTNGFNPHWKWLFANARMITYCHDGDEPGKQAARRVMSILGQLPDPKTGIQPMPDGEDVNSLYLKDPRALRGRLHV